MKHTSVLSRSVIPYKFSDPEVLAKYRQQLDGEFKIKSLLIFKEKSFPQVKLTGNVGFTYSDRRKTPITTSKV